MRLLFTLLLSFTSLFSNQLQEAINSASPFATIKLQEGIYRGNITINKPLTIVGVDGNVIIEGEKKGSVIRILSSHVTLKNLHIRSSGEMSQSIDAGISIKSADTVEISHCSIEDVLYGIDMDMVNNSLITHNKITTLKNELPLRGDALKIYYSHYNHIEFNTIYDVRDITLDYSNFNIFKNNEITGSRFSTHISNSKGNKLLNNRYRYNSVAMMFMGAKDTKVVNNEILSSRGAAGIGVMIGGISNFILQKNRISFNAKAIYIQGQEKAKGMKRYILDNEISYNGEALHFHATIKDNTIKNNRIFSNIDDVVKDVAGSFSDTNIVEYNYWDRYEGFDSNNDGIGDTPHEVYQYGDMLWHYNNKIKFFYASPIMTLINFLSNLAPFIEPNLIMRDSKPIYLSP